MSEIHPTSRLCSVGGGRLAASLFALMASLAAAPAGAGHGGSPSPELAVVGQFPVEIEGLTTDVWAHGNFAYMGSFDQPLCSLDLTGIRVIDISDPTSPEQVAFIPAKPGTRNNDVKVAHLETRHFTGEILVASNEPCNAPFNPRQNATGMPTIPGQGGLAIWDVTDPTKPRALKQNFFKFGVHNTFIWQQGDSAYMMVVDDDNVQDVHIVDITKPQAPKEIAVTGQLDWPDLDSSEIEGPAVFLHDVWVQENADGDMIAYLSYWDAGLVLLDVSDPADPVFLGDSTYPVPDVLSGLPPEGNGHVAAPTEDGRVAILGDEDFGKFSVFAVTSEGSFKVGLAQFGPDPLTSFPAPGDIINTGGLGCTTGDIPLAPGTGTNIALIERGACFFSTKAANAEAQGYDAYIVFNNAAGGDGLINMSAGTDDVITIPGIFIGNTAGTTLTLATDPTLSALSSIVDGEGFMRVLDVSNPASIVQLGHFATEGVFVTPEPLENDRTAHNVIVRGQRAYWSWYFEGMRVVDFITCAPGGGFESCTPEEVAHFVDTGEEPFSLNDHSNFWGVYVHDHPDGNTYILGSDRDSGLWIFADPPPAIF